MTKFLYSTFLETGMLLVVLTSGCAVNDMLQGSHNALIGSWQIKDSSKGTQVVTFHADGRYEVDLEADGMKDIWGTYTLFNNQIKFQDEGGEIDKNCNQGGVYLCSVKRRDLQFILAGDQCPERIAALSEVWTKYKRPQASKSFWRIF